MLVQAGADHAVLVSLEVGPARPGPAWLSRLAVPESRDLMHQCSRSYICGTVERKTHGHEERRISIGQVAMSAPSGNLLFQMLGAIDVLCFSWCRVRTAFWQRLQSFNAHSWPIQQQGSHVNVWT
jgi:hypothetical protein